MATVIDQNYLNYRAIQFDDSMFALASKTVSRFMPHVRIKDMKGKAFTSNNLDDKVNMEEITSGYEKREPSVLEKGVRRAFLKKFEKTLWTDEEWLQSEQFADILQDDLVIAMNKARNRNFDDLCVNTIFRDVLTGENGDTVVTFADDRATQIGAGGSNFDRDKILSIIEEFSANDFDEEDMRIKLVLGTSQIKSLLNDDYYINNDYSGVQREGLMRAYTTGQGSIENMDIIKYNGLPTDANNNRRVIAFLETGLEIRQAMGTKTKIREDNTRRGDPYMVIAKQDFAGLRKEGKQFVEVLCKES
jgi:hypothetical protein